MLYILSFEEVIKDINKKSAEILESMIGYICRFCDIYGLFKLLHLQHVMTSFPILKNINFNTYIYS